MKLKKIFLIPVCFIGIMFPTISLSQERGISFVPCYNDTRKIWAPSDTQLFSGTLAAGEKTTISSLWTHVIDDSTVVDTLDMVDINISLAFNACPGTNGAAIRFYPKSSICVTCADSSAIAISKYFFVTSVVDSSPSSSIPLHIVSSEGVNSFVIRNRDGVALSYIVSAICMTPPDTLQRSRP